MIRLPARLLDPVTAQRYCTTDSATPWAEDGEGRLASIISARAALAAGDLRLLYLAWLHSVGAGDLDGDDAHLRAELLRRAHGQSTAHPRIWCR